jgi:hypothetical protein
MITRKTLAVVWQISLVLIVGALVFCGACGGKPAAALSSSTIQTVSPLSNFGNVSADVFGAATFEGYDQTFNYPIEFNIPPISITWMGLIFNGLLQGAGPGSDTIYKVHGSVTADGAWIDSMIFSKEVRPLTGVGSFFQVALKNVPLTRNVDTQGTVTFICQKTASDVQRFVGDIQYANVGNFTYVQTDLGDPTCPARFTLTMATGPGIQAGDDKASQNPGILC